MNFLSLSYGWIISRRFPRLETVSVDTEDAASTAPPSVSLEVPPDVALISLPAVGFGGTSTFLPLDVPLVDSELLELVGSTWLPDPLINTVTSRVGLDLLPVTMVGNFLLRRRNPYKILFLWGVKEILMKNGGLVAFKASKMFPPSHAGTA